MKIAYDLRDRAFDAEKLVFEEIVDFNRFVFVETLCPRVVRIGDIRHPWGSDHLIQTGMRKFSYTRLFLYAFQILDQSAIPYCTFTICAITFDQRIKRRNFYFFMALHINLLSCLL